MSPPNKEVGFASLLLLKEFAPNKLVEPPKSGGFCSVYEGLANSSFFSIGGDGSETFGGDVGGFVLLST